MIFLPWLRFLRLPGGTQRSCSCEPVQREQRDEHVELLSPDYHGKGHRTPVQCRTFHPCSPFHWRSQYDDILPPQSPNSITQKLQIYIEPQQRNEIDVIETTIHNEKISRCYCSLAQSINAKTCLGELMPTQLCDKQAFSPLHHACFWTPFNRPAYLEMVLFKLVLYKLDLGEFLWILQSPYCRPLSQWLEFLRICSSWWHRWLPCVEDRAFQRLQRKCTDPRAEKNIRYRNHKIPAAVPYNGNCGNEFTHRRRFM